MKKRQLAEMIKEMVRVEVRQQVSEVITEMYLRKLVNETTNVPQQRKLTFEETFEHEMTKLRDEHVPDAMDNSDEGIYQQGTIARKNESVRSKLLSSKNPYSDLLRDTVNRQNESNSVNESAGSRLQGFDPERIGEIFRATKSSSNAPMKKSPDAVMRDLEMKRAALDQKKV